MNVQKVKSVKRVSFILVLSLIVLLLPACDRNSANYIIDNKPKIEGTVEEINEDTILMENETGKYLVSLDIKNKDSMTDFYIGDVVYVYYDGVMLETYPAQINNALFIALKTPSKDRPQRDQVQFVFFSKKWVKIEAIEIVSKDG